MCARIPYPTPGITHLPLSGVWERAAESLIRRLASTSLRLAALRHILCLQSEEGRLPSPFQGQGHTRPGLAMFLSLYLMDSGDENVCSLNPIVFGAVDLERFHCYVHDR